MHKFLLFLGHQILQYYVVPIIQFVWFCTFVLIMQYIFLCVNAILFSFRKVLFLFRKISDAWKHMKMYEESYWYVFRILKYQLIWLICGNIYQTTFSKCFNLNMILKTDIQEFSNIYIFSENKRTCVCNWNDSSYVFIRFSYHFRLSNWLIAILAW